MTATSTAERRHLAAVLFLFAGIAVLLSLADRAPLHPKPPDPAYDLEYQFDFYLGKAVNQELPGPHAYRVLVPYVVYGIHAVTGIPALTVDFVVKVLLLVAVQVIFFLSLCAFFDGLTSLCGVFLLDVYLGAALSYPVGPSVIETSDILNVLVFSVALKALYERKIWLLMGTMFLGTLNRETTWLILPAVFLAEWKEGRRWRTSLLAVAMVAAPYILVHLLVQSPSPAWWTTRDIAANIPFLSEEQTLAALAANVRVALILGPLAFLGFYRFREQQQFLRQAAAIIPLFVVAHYLVGRIIEVRLWLPVVPVLIPLALGTLGNFLAAEKSRPSGGP